LKGFEDGLIHLFLTAVTAARCCSLHDGWGRRYSRGIRRTFWV